MSDTINYQTFEPHTTCFILKLVGCTILIVFLAICAYLVGDGRVEDEHEAEARRLPRKMSSIVRRVQVLKWSEIAAAGSDDHNKTKLPYQAAAAAFAAANGDEENKCLQSFLSSQTSSYLDLDDCESCAICLGRFDGKDVVCRSYSSSTSSCAHIFHLKCMAEWLSTHDDCPVCREKFIRKHPAAEAASSRGSGCNTLELCFSSMGFGIL